MVEGETDLVKEEVIFGCFAFFFMSLYTALYSEKILKMQKKVIRIIANLRVRDSCRELFKKM
jgi:hypothetical protein